MEEAMALKEKTNSFLSFMLGDWEWYLGTPCKSDAVLWLFWCRYGCSRECEERLEDRGLLVELHGDRGCCLI